MVLINPFDNKEIKYKDKWEEKLFDCWMFEKLMNLDLKGTTYESRGKWLNKFKLNEKGDFEMIKYYKPDKQQHTKVDILLPDDELSIDTYRNFNELINQIKEEMKTHDEITLEFGWETWDLDDSSTNRSINIKKLSRGE